MLEGNIPSTLVQLFASYLREKRFRINLNGSRSSLRALTASVRQGLLFSPALFTIFARHLHMTPNTKHCTRTTPSCWIATWDRDLWVTCRRRSRIGFGPDGSKSIPIRAPRSRWSSDDTVPTRVTLDARLTCSTHIDKWTVALGRSQRRCTSCLTNVAGSRRTTSSSYTKWQFDVRNLGMFATLSCTRMPGF